jgi:hypothetical protein
MRWATLRGGLVAGGVVGLVVAGVPAAQAAPAHASRTSVGDRCLIGTWHDNHNRTSTRMNGKRVVMHAGGGDVDHIAASGVDHDSWADSLPLVGRYLHHPLTEQVRGENTQLIHSSRKHHHLVMTVTEQGWSVHSTNRYTYRGKHFSGYLNQSGVHTYRFRCTATTLTFLGPKGKVTGTETRLSR